MTAPIGKQTMLSSSQVLFVKLDILQFYIRKSLNQKIRENVFFVNNCINYIISC